jgi:hypothetical protein
MSKSMHTPGPWKVGDFGLILADANPCKDAIVAQAEGLNKEENARLIAAAPVLLEALKGMIEAGHLGVKLNVRKSEHYSWMNAEACARKAVLQAEGG